MSPVRMSFLRLPAQLSPEERRTSLVAFGFLVALMLAHSFMETVRDTLFLSALPPERLPYVYLVIVAVSLVVSRRLTTVLTHVKVHVALQTWLIASAAVTLGFWAFIERMGEWGFYGLYVWSAVGTTVALIQFWTLLGDILAMRSAKQIYAFIGAGSAIGAIAGSGLSAGITQMFGARDGLVLVAAVLVVSAIAPFLLGRWNSEKVRTPEPSKRSEGLGTVMRKTMSTSYTRQVALLVAASAITVTLGDYVFKSSVAATVPEDELGLFFGAAYFAFNVVGLFVQLVLVNTVIRRFTLTSSLGILPALILMGGTGFFLGGGVLAALALRGSDGALRHSLHRTALELLYVPLGHTARQRLKVFNDLLAQRGAQAFASILILGVVAAGASLHVIAFILCTSAAAWLLVAASMRRPYLDLFRRKLDPEMTPELAYPELDVESLESMIAALNDTDDAKVIAAMDLLGREGLVNTIPALILYHPSEEVALRAIDIFAEYDRRDFVAVARRRLPDAGPLLRASLIAATAKVSADPEELLGYYEQHSAPTVRLTAAVFLIHGGWGDADELRATIRTELAVGRVPCSLSFLRAVRHTGAENFSDELGSLMDSPDTLVRKRAIAEIVRLGDLDLLPKLRDELAKRETRRSALRALHRWGAPARDQLLLWLEDRSVNARVRWQLPRAIGQFPADEVAQRLTANLIDEPDGMVRYRTIVELDRIQRRDGRLDLRKGLLTVGRDLMVYAFELADWRVTLQRFAEESPESVTSTHQLLERLIADKEANVADLIVRLIGILQPGEDVDSIARGLRSHDDVVRSSALELIEHLLPAEAREELIALLAGTSPQVRLQRAEPFYSPRKLSYPELLSLLLGGRSFMLRSLAARLIGQMQMTELRESLAGHRDAGSPEFDLVVERALQSLDTPRELSPAE